MKRNSSLDALIRAGRVRNRLLIAKTVQAEVRAAADRVQRLSDPGTPARFFTVMEVARETGVKGSDIVRELVRKSPTDGPHR